MAQTRWMLKVVVGIGLLALAWKLYPDQGTRSVGIISAAVGAFTIVVNGIRLLGHDKR